MRERSVRSTDLFLDTLRYLGYLLPVWAVIALVKFIAYRLLSIAGSSAVAVSLLFGAFFFAAPLAASAARHRRRLRLLSRAGGKTIGYCFAWGAAVVALFVAALQLWQGMAATPTNYLVAALTGGTFCALTAAIPTGRNRFAA